MNIPAISVQMCISQMKLDNAQKFLIITADLAMDNQIYAYCVLNDTSLMNRRISVRSKRIL